MKLFASIVGKIVFFVTCLALLFGASFTIPKIFGYYPFIVLSGSMEPTIPTGSVLYSNTNDTEVEIGDIITYRLATDKGEDVLVTHRLVDIRDGQYITKGDNNDVEDFVPLTKEQIVGTYTFHAPRIGYLMAKIDEKIVKVAIVWVCLLNVFSIVLSKLAEDEEDEEETKEKDSENSVAAKS